MCFVLLSSSVWCMNLSEWIHKKEWIVRMNFERHIARARMLLKHLTLWLFWESIAGNYNVVFCTDLVILPLSLNWRNTVCSISNTVQNQWSCIIFLIDSLRDWLRWFNRSRFIHSNLKKQRFVISRNWLILCGISSSMPEILNPMKWGGKEVVKRPCCCNLKFHTYAWHFTCRCISAAYHVTNITQNLYHWTQI